MILLDDRPTYTYKVEAYNLKVDIEADKQAQGGLGGEVNTEWKPRILHDQPPPTCAVHNKRKQTDVTVGETLEEEGVWIFFWKLIIMIIRVDRRMGPQLATNTKFC